MSQQMQMSQRMSQEMENPMHFGTSWYPEQWPAERWATDLALMRDAGMNVVRLGDFAWSRLEPDEGRYDLDWFVRAVDLAGEHGISCVVNTPTAGPPVWLTSRYPEVLVVDAEGRRAVHGNRAHASVTSSRYRRFCVAVAEAMAERLGGHEAVIGWQVDNELNTVSYDDETRATFHDWLHRRYGSIERLNTLWTTTFWSQEYTAFEQVPIPVGVHHPALALAWRRFVTDTFRDHVRAQADVIRAHARPDQWITHNVWSWYDGFDQHAFAAEVDTVGLDFYVGHLDNPDAGAVHDIARGLKRRPYWLMEAQPGSACWSGVNNVLDRGEARRLAWHAVGHGADAVLYWQWRGPLGGQEQYHGTLLGADGTPRPFFAEAVQVGAELAAAAPALAGTTPRPGVAILQGYPDRWAIDLQRHHRDFDPVTNLLRYYRPLRRRGIDVDIVRPADLTPPALLTGYRLIVAPSLHIIDERVVAALLDWVHDGGHLLLGVRSGVKDEENAFVPHRPPGAIGAGVAVAEHYALDRAVPVAGILTSAALTSAALTSAAPASAAPTSAAPASAAPAAGGAFAEIWAEALVATAPGSEVLLRYEAGNGWLDGEPAVVTTAVGAGSVTYCGAWLDPATTQALIDRLTAAADVPVWADLPADVEVCRREDPTGRTVVVVLNHGRSAHTVELPRPGRDLLTGENAGASIKVEAGGVRVVQESPAE